jgi:hypothetical protein
MAPVVALTAAALETNQAASVGRFWLLRVPSANVSSKMLVAWRFTMGATSRAKQSRLFLRRSLVLMVIVHNSNDDNHRVIPVILQTTLKKKNLFDYSPDPKPSTSAFFPT